MKVITGLLVALFSINVIADDVFGGNGFYLNEYKRYAPEAEYVFDESDGCLGTSKYVYGYFNSWVPSNLEKTLNPHLNENTQWVKLRRKSCTYGAQSMSGSCKLFHDKKRKLVTLFLCGTE